MLSGPRYAGLTGLSATRPPASFEHPAQGDPTARPDGVERASLIFFEHLHDPAREVPGVGELNLAFGVAGGQNFSSPDKTRRPPGEAVGRVPGAHHNPRARHKNGPFKLFRNGFLTTDLGDSPFLQGIFLVPLVGPPQRRCLVYDCRAVGMVVGDAGDEAVGPDVTGEQPGRLPYGLRVAEGVEHSVPGAVLQGVEVFLAVALQRFHFRERGFAFPRKSRDLVARLYGLGYHVVAEKTRPAQYQKLHVQSFGRWTSSQTT